MLEQVNLKKQVNLEILFPTYVGWKDNPRHNEWRTHLINKCDTIQKQVKSGGENWKCDVYTTNGTYNILEDKSFKMLNDWIFDQVNIYCNSLDKNNKKIEMCHGWFNSYEKDQYQESHVHTPYDVSVIYILKADSKEEPNIIFERDIFTMGVSNDVSYESVEGRLFIFRSTLKHKVGKKLNNNKRITLSYNFKTEGETYGN